MQANFLSRFLASLTTAMSSSSFIYSLSVGMDAKFKPFSKIGKLPILHTHFSCKVSRTAASASNPYNLPGSKSPCRFLFPKIQIRLIGLHSSTQNFLINCFSCGGGADIADGCTVTHVQTGHCVTDNGGGSTLSLTPCTGAFNQEYNFHSPWFISKFFLADSQGLF